MNIAIKRLSDEISLVMENSDTIQMLYDELGVVRNSKFVSSFTQTKLSIDPYKDRPDIDINLGVRKDGINIYVGFSKKEIDNKCQNKE